MKIEFFNKHAEPTVWFFIIIVPAMFFGALTLGYLALAAMKWSVYLWENGVLLP